MRYSWASSLDLPGIGFGYTSHQRQLRAALERRGAEITDDAEIAVSIVPAGNFRYVRGKFNILYTMYEATTIPPNWIAKVKAADLVVVPCRHNKELFQRYTKGPVEYCWEGVDVGAFAFHERQFPDLERRPFIFLWFGASNPRKGYKHMIVSWAIWRHRYPELQHKVLLLMKTTQLAPAERVVGYEKGQPIRQMMPIERIFTADNAIVDTRRLPMNAPEIPYVVGKWVDEKAQWPGLVQLYQAAHCFVFPTMGEGFGLTLAEAMATGCPCIYTDWSGPRDFISSTEGYPLRWHWSTVTAQTPQADGTMRSVHTAHAASVDPDDVVRRMEQVFFGYEEALKRGRLAAARIRRDITWDKSAASFEAIVSRHYEAWKAKRQAVAA